MWLPNMFPGGGTGVGSLHHGSAGYNTESLTVEHSGQPVRTVSHFLYVTSFVDFEKW
jgi:hypothetical protein